MSETTVLIPTAAPPHPYLQNIGLAALAGSLQMFSLPNMFYAGYSLWHSYLALVSFIPYIILWRRVSSWSAFVYSTFMGYIYFFGVLSWIRLLNRDTNLDNALAWLFFAFCGGCYFGLFGLTTRLVKNRFPWSDLVILPAGWVAWEFLRGHILTGGWPWASLGHSQYANLLTRQVASITGVGGISFAIVAINLLLLDGFLGLRRAWQTRLRPACLQRDFWQIAPWKARFQTSPMRYGLYAALALLWLFIFFELAIETIAFTHTVKKPVQVAMVQANIDTRARWNQAYRTAVMTKMTRLHTQAAEKKPDLILWSESCFPAIIEHPGYVAWETQLRALVRKNQIPTLMTSNEYVREKNIEELPIWHHYNSAFYLGPQGQTLGRYRKIHLVPFGEYIPYNILKGYLHAIVREPIPIDFEPGDDFSVFTLGQTSFSVFICYEDIFEELGYQFAQNGADFFVCVANNSWSGHSPMSYQHNAMSAFLAIEHRAYMAKADMSGPSCIIDPWGNIGTTLPYFQEGVKFETIYPQSFTTFFTRFGNLIPWIFVSLFFFLCLGWLLHKLEPQPSQNAALPAPPNDPAPLP